jgi:hypothetical protein
MHPWSVSEMKSDLPITEHETSRRRAVPALVIVLAVLPLMPAEAQVRREGRDWVQTEEGVLPAGGRLRVRSTGSITVRGDAASREVRYRVTKKVRAGSQEEAEQLLERARLTATRQGITAVISIDTPPCRRCGFSAEMLLDVPESTGDAVLETRGGDLDISNLDGRVRAETAGGSIALRRIGGIVSASTAGGSIVLDAIGGAIRAETAGGSISLNAAGADAVLNTSGGSISVRQVKGTLRAETAGGGVTAEQVGGSIIAGTSGGSIRLRDIKGSVRADTAGGSIHIASAPAGLRAETAGGDIQLSEVAGAVMAASAAGNIRAEFLRGQPILESILETNAGTIVVWLSEGVPLTVDAVVNLADSLRDVQSEFSSIVVNRQSTGLGPGTVTAKGEIGGGGPVLRIRNIDGRIQIRKLP